MPMYIKDDAVDILAKRFMKLSGSNSKTDAVRTALQNQIALLENKTPLAHRLAPCFDLVNAIGEPDPNFDQKAFADDLYEGM